MNHIRIEYAIGIQRIRDFQGSPLYGADRKWEYAGLCMPSNPYSDYWEAKFAPYDEKTFCSIEAAETWLNEYKKYLIPQINKYYDMGTLGFYKKTTIVQYEKEQSISFDN